MNSRAEAAFSSYEGEVSAVVYAVQRFRYYLWGQPFRLITDCKAMQWLTTTAKLRSKLARWSLILAEYDFEIVHRAGKDNTVPDLLSRQPTEKPVSYGPVTGIAFHTARRPSIPEQAMGFISGQWAAPVAAGWLAGYLLDSSSTRFDPWTDPGGSAVLAWRTGTGSGDTGAMDNLTAEVQPVPCQRRQSVVQSCSRAVVGSSAARPEASNCA